MMPATKRIDSSARPICLEDWMDSRDWTRRRSSIVGRSKSDKLLRTGHRLPFPRIGGVDSRASPGASLFGRTAWVPAGGARGPRRAGGRGGPGRVRSQAPDPRLRANQERAVGTASPGCRVLPLAAQCGHGTEMELTAAAGSVPDSHPWPPAVLGTIVGSSIFVRSTRANSLAAPFARSPIASPPLGLW